MKRIRYRSQGVLYTQRLMSRLERDGVHSEFVRDRCQDARRSAIPVGLQGLNARGAVKAIVEATGLNPHMSVCGWPFCLSDLDDAEGGAAWRS